MNFQEILRNAIEAGSVFLTRYRLWVILAIALLIAAGGSWFGYSTWLASKENELSRRVNRLSIELVNLAQGAENSLEAQDRIGAIYAEMEKIGRDNLRTQNGGRALFLAAHGDMQMGQFAKAREKYQLVYQKNRRHYLAPQALFYAAVATEEEGQIDKANELLREFERSYPAHWVLGEVQLALARNLAGTGKSEQAVALYDKMLADKSLESYHARVSDQKRILALRGYAPKASTPPLLPNP